MSMSCETFLRTLKDSDPRRTSGVALELWYRHIIECDACETAWDAWASQVDDDDPPDDYVYVPLSDEMVEEWGKALDEARARSQESPA